MHELARVVSVPSPGGVDIRVSGDIDLSNLDRLTGEVVAAVSAFGEPAGGEVAIDLSEVGHFGSAGLRLLDAASGAAQEAGAAFRVVVPLDAPSRRVIEIAGVAAYLRLDPPGPAERA
ncbi:MAG: STAS domain-containing protein [Acidimicrobiales bacterium]